MINASTIGMMKRGVMLINTGRGKLDKNLRPDRGAQDRTDRVGRT